jgi:bifunctional DNase/RNase
MELRRAVVDGVRIQMISGTHVLLLRDAEEARYLPIPIGPNEASAIAYHLQGVTPERPLTHDTALQAIRALGATLRELTRARAEGRATGALAALVAREWGGGQYNNTTY